MMHVTKIVNLIIYLYIMEHSTIQLKDYVVIHNIAEGTYGEVYKVQHKTTKQIFALKMMLISYLIKVKR